MELLPEQISQYMFLYLTSPLKRLISKSSHSLIDTVLQDLAKSLTHEFHYISECPDDQTVKEEVCFSIHNSLLDILEDKDETEGKSMYYEVLDALEIHVVSKPGSIIICVDVVPDTVNDAYYDDTNFTLQ